MYDIDMGSTTPFHTFDPADGDALESFASILDAARTGGGDAFDSLEKKHPEIVERLGNESVDVAAGRASLAWDDATLLFIAARAMQEDGSPAEPLDRGITMERLGRFPSEDGNAISYLRSNLLTDDAPLTALLDQLDVGLRAESRGHDHLSAGFGGLRLHGWLNTPQVTELREALLKVAGKVAKDEPFDGGVREVVRHLTILMKGAEKRMCGILMRAHH